MITNTPLSSGESLAEELMGRKLTDNLMPVINPSSINGEVEVRKLADKRQIQKEDFDKKVACSRTHKKVTTFTSNERVIMQNSETRTWYRRGRIVNRVYERSYDITADYGTIFRRNIKCIKRFIPMDNLKVNTDITSTNASGRDVRRDIVNTRQAQVLLQEMNTQRSR